MQTYTAGQSEIIRMDKKNVLEKSGNWVTEVGDSFTTSTKAG
jgi:hypothetical protein